MAKSPSATEKQPGFFSQLRSLFRFTREIYPWLPWAQIAILVAGILIGVIVGYLIPPFQIWSVVLWGVTGLLAGVLGAMFVIHMQSVLPYALCFAAGAMIFVVVEELIPESQRVDAHIDIVTMATMTGFSVMMILDVALG